ncbi:mannose-1-phosphate guanyltransferase [Marmoricola endophyticus]|uniref:Mannose-1-phosphate guanyltransferase n=1 Tax=Marmoricola endophyticus TaxID=2040280 RepID=A0A917BRK5_9ACTN|nr:mannose-1-phosphate guanylyltransferase [Marmoricola endophyticus]GGF56344.1 mannose-1-phosphate guanyltransferase [Marmoricola endophyticus]
MTQDATQGPGDRLWAIVPAGGAGTRLWPLSRASSPKFLHDLTGSGRTLVQATVDRLVPLVGERLLVVTGTAHRDAVLSQTGLPGERVLAEPTARDSMAAIGLAAAHVERIDPDGLVGSFAADHVIGDDALFRRTLVEAAAVADTGLLVTIGIEPTGPSTAFGYVRPGAPLDGFASARAVVEFVEKPDAQRAAAYVEQGYRWNAGMFVARASTLLDLLAAHHPPLAAGLRAIAAEPGSLEERWPGLQRIAIDHAVAEPAAAAGRVAVVPGSFGWDDVGDFASLRELLDRGAADHTLTVLGDPDRVVAHEATGLVVPGGRVLAVAGLEDVVVVDTGDAVLVTRGDRAQDVKRLVEQLRGAGHSDLL